MPSEKNSSTVRAVLYARYSSDLHGLADKNRQLLEHLDDPAFMHRG